MSAAILSGAIVVVLGICVAAGLRADRARKRDDGGGEQVSWFDAGDGDGDCSDGGGCGGDGGGGDWSSSPFTRRGT